MRVGRLLIVVLAAASVSACTPFTAYRTTLPEVLEDGSRPVYFECAVDEAARAENRRLCLCEGSDASDSQTIQRRHYTGSYKPAPPEEPDPVTEGNYYLSFVEFDDQGWFADREQMNALLTLLEDLEEDGTEALIYVYAHGWKHNASSGDDNVVCFSRLLERLDVAEKKVFGSERVVVGVYLGWRGLPYKGGTLTNFSFWNRKEAAQRVGRGSVFELLARLDQYRDLRQDKVPDPHKTQLFITGHSFGGLVIYSALSHALMERAAKRDGPTESFGDFVMLVNPAFEGSLYEPLYRLATDRSDYDDEQRPVMMIVTSEADGATRVAFPIGRRFSTLFQHAKDPRQARSMREAIGHDPSYQTHDLKYAAKAGEPEADSRKPADRDDCGCPHLDATADWDQASLAHFFGEGVAGLGGGSPRYGAGVSLTRASSDEPPYPARYPFLVVRTDGRIIADHNAIYNERFINFQQLFLIQNIAAGLPWDTGE